MYMKTYLFVHIYNNKGQKTLFVYMHKQYVK